MTMSPASPSVIAMVISTPEPSIQASAKILLVDCGNSIGGAGTNASDSDCNMACSGNSTQPCGGPNILTVFWSGKNPPVHDLYSDGYGWIGCYA
ncbi:hypothetical protein AOQ84DRAFT_176100 [Glonium stellatum]|uniref:WSC domain-containing protein n=1 Tax=Glonium stellatum TaxID=574774 RepID=A0A8E2F787_9PEZI|nr:hypothetical protein AOQ84DRAFT_176100 [Glonium stellatum]